MLIVGALVGAVLSFFFVAGPMAVAMAAALSIPANLPIIGTLTLVLFPVGWFGATIAHILFSLIAYAIAAIATPVPASGPVAATPPGGGVPAIWEFFEQFARGCLIGMNAVVALTLPLALPWLFAWLPPVSLLLVAASPLLGIAALVVFVIILIPVFLPALAANNTYAGALGWSAWISPGAWPATILGILVCAINSAAAVFGAPVRWLPELWTGSFMTHGGILYPFWRAPVGYNLGNFYFVDPRLGATTPAFVPPPVGAAPTGSFAGLTADGATLHETGHTLNVAAFGGWFTYIGALHENLFPPVLNGGARAYAELLAEAHLRDSTVPWFPFWAPPVGLTGLTPNAPPAYGAVTVDGLPPPGFLTVGAGSTLTLAGPSADPDGYPAAALVPGAAGTGVLWVFSGQPVAGAGVVAAATAVTTTAVVSRGGDYTLAFAASDGAELPTAGPLSFSIKAVEAVVVAPGQANVNQEFTLDGTMSSAGLALDGTPQPLTFAWSVTPPSAAIADAAAATTTLTPTETGPHDVTLTVTANAGFDVSHTAIRTVTVV